MKAILRYAFYPLLMTGGLLLVYVLLQHGVKAPVASMGATILGIACIMLVEWVLPFDAELGLADSDWVNDFKHLLLTQAVLPKLMTLAWTYLFVALAGWLSGFSYLASLWPHQWNLFAQFGMAVLVVSFFRYWAHRIGHEVHFLWHFHAIHHSAQRLYWLNAGRWNPLDKIFVSATEMLPFILLGIKPEVLALYAIFMAMSSLMQHANIDTRLGVLNYIFNSSASHRWHHSVVIEESNNNYGNPLAIWDLVFGTFYLPKDHQAVPPVMGLNPQHQSQGYIDDLVQPFRQLAKAARSVNQPDLSAAPQPLQE